MAKNETTTTQEIDNVQALLAAGSAIGEIRNPIVASHGRHTQPMAVVPKDMLLLPVPLADELPSHTSASIILENVDSFLVYVERFKTANTMLFANRRDGSIKAVFDYHAPDTDFLSKPGFCAHTCTVKPALTPEWQAWIGANKKRMSQDDMMEFLESWNGCIWSPDAATMLEIASSIEATKACTFKSVKRLANGQREFTYNEIIQATGQTTKGQIVIPEIFKLSLVRSFGQDGTHMDARFRYRIEDGRLILWYELVKLVEAEQDAFDGLCDQIKTGIGLAPLL